MNSNAPNSGKTNIEEMIKTNANRNIAFIVCMFYIQITIVIIIKIIIGNSTIYFPLLLANGSGRV